MMADQEYSGMTKPLERALRDAEAEARAGDFVFHVEDEAKLSEARKRWLAAERQRVVEPFIDAETAKELQSERRHRHVESAKQILQIQREVYLHCAVGGEDFPLDALAERLADLIFGKFSNGSH